MWGLTSSKNLAIDLGNNNTLLTDQSSILLSQHELTKVLERPFKQIEECIHQSLEICPPELSSAIYQSGIFVKGGNAQWKGVKERFSKMFKLRLDIDPQFLLSVSKGIGQILSDTQKFRSVLL